MDQFYVKEFNNRQKVLQEIQQTVGVMLSTNKADAGCQTGLDLIDAYIKVQEDERRFFANMETGHIMANKNLSPGMKTYLSIQNQRQSTVPGSSRAGSQMSHFGVGHTPSTPFHLPPENTLINYGKTKT